ncbi:PTPA-CTERM sorting domain-containing protein [[Leptolyngbya] sp. PCC 7376]|uniref:PTPA-CTERM sorting domain-containing protein n=1 Tax=[Leptolyngbya] sp. PCC 7376 TaxID=111781 RepID=UPI00135AC85D|nr:PTPA-CTERM sorting domain-containing protein [[Leptolyngbya] sp. PCC 7376]
MVSAAIGVGLVAAPSVNALEITTASGTYELELVLGSFDANADEIKSTSWWGNSSLAEELAQAVVDQNLFSDLGDPDLGVLFGYAQPSGDNTRVDVWAAYTPEAIAINFPELLNYAASNTYSYSDNIYWTKPYSYWISGGTVEVESVPTPAAILPVLTGLFGSAIRKRKEEDA